DAYDNMMLQNLDIVNVSEDSNMQVKLDEDKYILLEPKTRIHLEATGTSEDSKTKIYLEEGAIVCNIQNPLSENSTYEVNTPNSTMAVRGTTFRVALEYDEAGDSYTVAAVFEGTVESFLVYPDGTVAKEGVSIEKGSQVLIKGTDEDSMYIVTNQEISYEEFKKVTLEFLNILIEKGEELSITEDVIQEFIEKIEEEELLVSTEETEDSEMEDAEQTNSEEEEDSEVETETESEKSTENDSETTENATEDTEADSESTGTSGNTGSGSTTQTKTYTVTFTYNGVTFATQEVTSGKCAVEPKLKPAAEGEWDFDFTKTITANTTIEWVESSASAEE
ncbi:MAG: FecR domain-containing protein, partial [Lachnospiraceae bacterium]|nr:FecR domain-containing protein [Lachnospiraceae bacterium]